MELKEFREIMNEYMEKNQAIETHENRWLVMSEFVNVNNITMHFISEINVVLSDEISDCVWFDSKINIHLEDVEELHICSIKSYSEE